MRAIALVTGADRWRRRGCVAWRPLGSECYLGAGEWITVIEAPHDWQCSYCGAPVAAGELLVDVFHDVWVEGRLGDPVHRYRCLSCSPQVEIEGHQGGKPWTGN